MKLWSSGISRSKTNAARLEDTPRCWMKYDGEIIPLEDWPEIQDDAGNFIPIYASLSDIRNTIRIIPKKSSDTQMMTKELLTRYYFPNVSKDLIIQDCVVVYDRRTKLTLHNFIISGVSDQNVFCSVDFCEYGIME